MKRKTNLFYTKGTDSNFITFSNYTESMTGNYLSTDTKLFPSAFICAYIDGLDASNRESFIDYVVARYENKLAFMRDKCVENNYNIEEKIKPLNWLIETINSCGLDVYINYIGQITEQDYNGVFADMICTIESSSKKNGEIIYKEASLDNIEKYDEYNSYIYGWSVFKKDVGTQVWQGPNNYKNLKPQFDGTLGDAKDPYYNYDSTIKEISLEQTSENDGIEFNIVIPLFDVININDNTNTTNVVSELSSISLYKSTDKLNTRFVPYGIWFSGDSPVILPRHEYSPSWSLVLSSQFKPFPYSKSNPNEIDDAAKADAYQTFSQILVRQNEILDKINVLSNTILSLNNRISDIEGNIKSIGTSYNIDGIHLTLLQMQNDINELNQNK